MQELPLCRNINNTSKYITIEKALSKPGSNDEYHVKVAHDLEEACRRVEVGFEDVTDKDGVKILRKRK